MREKFRKLITAVAAMSVIFSVSIQASAEGFYSVEEYYEQIDSDTYVYDFAELMNEEEVSEIQKQIEEARGKSKLDIVVLTVDDNFGYSQRQLADDFYDNGDFGFEDNIQNGSGVLLLIDMDDRQMYISTAGIGILYINDEIIEILLDDIEDDIKGEDYYEACQEFVEDMVYCSNMAAATPQYESIIEDWYSENYDDYVELYDANREEFEKITNITFNYDKGGIITGDWEDLTEVSYDGYKKITFFTLFQNPLLDLVIGAVVGAIAVFALRNPQKAKMSVNNMTYKDEKKVNLKTKRDTFIRRSTVSRKIESSSGKSGGGSSHSSSGGSSHGGGGRGF